MQYENKSVIDDLVSNLVIAPLGYTHIELAEKIAGRALGEGSIDITGRFMDPRKFSVGEFCPRFVLGDNQNLVGKSVYMILTPGPHKDPEGQIKRAEMVAFAAKSHGAKKVVLLSTDLPHARQDRGPDEDQKALGELNTMRLHARTFEASGIDQVIVTHEHSPRTAAFYAMEYGLVPQNLLDPSAQGLKIREIKDGVHYDPNNPLIQDLGRQVYKSINVSGILADYLLHHSSLKGSSYLNNKGEGLVLKAMDRGNRMFINQLWESLFLENTGRVYCNKARTSKNDPDTVEVEIESVSDKFTSFGKKLEIDADDGLDTGGTMIKAAKWSSKGNICSKTGKIYGTPESRIVHFTHPWLGGESYKNIQERLIKTLPASEFTTINTRPYVSDTPYYRMKDKLSIIRLASLWGDAILANELELNIMERYTGFASEPAQHQFLDSLYQTKRHSTHFLGKEKSNEKFEIKFPLR